MCGSSRKWLGGEESGEGGATDTSIEGEDEEMHVDLVTLALPDLAGCSCCKSCLRKKKMAERKPRAEVPYSVGSDRSKRRKKAARVKGVGGVEEAQDIVDRLYRDFPDLQAKYSSRTTNLRLMTLIRDLRLSYNQVSFISLFFFLDGIFLLFLLFLLVLLFLLFSFFVSPSFPSFPAFPSFLSFPSFPSFHFFLVGRDPTPVDLQ